MCQRTPAGCTRRHSTLGRLAIFLGFFLSVLLFVEIQPEIQGILIGSVMIVVLGYFDDIMTLKALPKFLVQIAAAGVAVYYAMSSVFVQPHSHQSGALSGFGQAGHSGDHHLIVAITNAVNFIDGLDGLAVGVSAISSATLLVTAMLIAEGNVAIIMRHSWAPAWASSLINEPSQKSLWATPVPLFWAIFWPQYPFRACLSCTPLFRSPYRF